MGDDVFLLYFLDLLGFINLFLSLWHRMSRRVSFDILVFVEKVDRRSSQSFTSLFSICWVLICDWLESRCALRSF